MAKASKQDVRNLIDFFQFIEEFMDDGTHTPENGEAEFLTDQEFVQALRRLWGGRFRPAGVDCSWNRVVFGCDVLIDNVCDPDLDYLELRPELKKNEITDREHAVAMAMLLQLVNDFEPVDQSDIEDAEIAKRVAEKYFEVLRENANG